MSQSKMMSFLSLLAFLPLNSGFVSSHRRRSVAFSPWTRTLPLAAAAEKEDGETLDGVLNVTDTFNNTLFPGSHVLEFTLLNHKPLGCTVEESLAHPMEKHIFITKVRIKNPKNTPACA